MSKVTRDGMMRGLTTDRDWDSGDRMPPRAHEPAAVSAAPAPPAAEGPPPRKRLDLNATITLSEEALAALLEEVKSGRGAGLDDGAEGELPAAAPEPAVPQPWIRFEGNARRKF